MRLLAGGRALIPHDIDGRRRSAATRASLLSSTIYGVDRRHVCSFSGKHARAAAFTHAPVAVYRPCRCRYHGGCFDGGDEMRGPTQAYDKPDVGFQAGCEDSLHCAASDYFFLPAKYFAILLLFLPRLGRLWGFSRPDRMGRRI